MFPVWFHILAATNLRMKADDKRLPPHMQARISHNCDTGDTVMPLIPGLVLVVFPFVNSHGQTRFLLCRYR
jgi:hypothetical protein